VVSGGPPGRSRLGCLASLLLVAAAGYFAVDFADAYWRYYRFRDAMEQETRFADRKSDAEIVRRLQAKADSLGLPDEASDVDVQRGDSGIQISSDYRETVKLPFASREIGFHPRAARSF
jgi:hypothetical protein